MAFFNPPVPLNDPSNPTLPYSFLWQIKHMVDLIRILNSAKAIIFSLHFSHINFDECERLLKTSQVRFVILLLHFEAPF